MSEPLEAAIAEVAFAYERVAFFRKHLDAAGIDPRALRSAEEWQRIPTTRKAHYRRNFPAGVLARGRTLDQPGVFRAQSSGTEGERLVTACETSTLSMRWLSCLSINPRFSYLLSTRNLRTVRYAAPNCSDVECANPNSTMNDRVLPDRTLVLPVYHDLLTTPEPMLVRAAAETAEYAPHFMYADPTHLAFLIRTMRVKGAPPWKVPGIACGYTQLTRISRRQIAEYLPSTTPIAEVVAMSEFGWIAMECPQGRLHLNTDSYFVELLTSLGTARPGEVGELCLTSLGDRLSPHLRYRTGDLYRWVESPCSCPSQFPSVLLEGRACNVLVREEGKRLVTPRDIDGCVGDPEGMELYQMDQTGADEFVFRYIADERFEPAHQESLRERLAKAIGPGGRLVVERVRYISAERSGKVLACKSAIARERERRRES